MESKTIVIKVGSSSVVDDETHHAKIAMMSQLVDTVFRLKQEGHRVVLVSSGAIAMGMIQTHTAVKPKKLAAKQALAAIGQGKLMSLWDNMFKYYNQLTSQILITRNDIVNFTQFQNAQNTLLELLDMGVVPIVNENDTISTQEIKFGDNDTLSAITGGMVGATHLVLLTDVDCLCTDDPRSNPDAKRVAIVDDMNDLNVNTKSGAGSKIGTGGMETKLIAADLATNGGVSTIICNSKDPAAILKILAHEPLPRGKLSFEQWNEEELAHIEACGVPLHTKFIGQSWNHVKNKQFWLLHGLKPKGALVVDYGCYQAITRSNRAGLLPVGITAVQGDFEQLECVELRLGFPGTDKTVGFGRGRCNYSSEEVAKIKGLHSDEIRGVLEYCDSEYVVVRDNLAFPLHQDKDLVEFINTSLAACAGF